MKSQTLAVLSAVSGIVGAWGLAGCAMPRTSAPSAAELQTSPENATLMKSRIRSWSAVDDHTLIIEANDGTRYKAETMGPCTGLSFTTHLGFANRGGFNQIDRFSSVQLPDGTRCAFQSFGKIVTPEARALDNYEKKTRSEKAEGDTTPR